MTNALPVPMYTRVSAAHSVACSAIHHCHCKSVLGGPAPAEAAICTMRWTLTSVSLSPFIPCSAFGELALLYSAPRAATVRTSAPCQLWVAQRSVVNTIKRHFAQRLIQASGLASRQSEVEELLVPGVFRTGVIQPAGQLEG